MTLHSATPTLTEEPLLLVVDLEATCWKDQISPDGEPQSVFNMEIIELGCAIATRQGKLLDSLSLLVRPVRNPILSDFCKTLTGISQPMVDNAKTYPESIQYLTEWLGQQAESFIWSSWGNYDLRHVAIQGEMDGALAPMLNYPHLNLKRLWRRTTGQRKKNGLVNALAFHGLVFEGDLHRGVDDARNIVRLLSFIDWSLEEKLARPPGSIS